MSVGDAISILRAALFELLILSSPVLFLAVGIGFIISIMQAITSIQEQTLTFVPKMIGIIVLLILLGPWMGIHLMNFTESMWRQLSVIVR